MTLNSLLITRIRPSIWVCSYPVNVIAHTTNQETRPEQIPTMEVIWSVLTMLLATSKNFNTVIVLRFFVGQLL